jgi:hypothetical protein
MRIRMNKIGGFLLTLLLCGPAFAEEPQAPVVVELFTAQNCAYCPPANAYLAKLNERDDIIALSYHVDYWKSPALKHLPNHTSRQRAYGHLIGKDRVYTPEMVINGADHATGYRKYQVASKIRSAKKSARIIEIGVEQFPSHISFSLPEIEESGGLYDIVVVPFKSEVTVSTQAGPLDDRTYTNLAFRPSKLGGWEGKARKVSVNLSQDARSSYSGFVLLLQGREDGTIIAAKKVLLKDAA